MYFLSKDCFVCRAEGYWIVLSTKRDKYLCVAHADLASIGGQLYGWQDPFGTVPTPPATEFEASTLIESLTANGIITGNSMIGKSFTEPQYCAPERQVQPHVPAARARRHAFRGAQVFRGARFFLACAIADWQLRANALSRTLTRIERRRARRESTTATRDAARVAHLVGAFKRLRPLYPRPYLCLFDSLALLEFLAAHRFFPQIVFGVVADPFQAHCWLQDGSTVFNDDVERVVRYKPILSV